MPRVFEIEGYRGFFFSNEGTPQEPVHIHNKEPRRKQRGIGEQMSDYDISPQAAGNLPGEIKKGEGEAKFWVTPNVILAESWSMKVSELTRAQEIIVEHRQEILDLWNRYFRV